MFLGAKIRDLRKEKKLTQQKLATLAGVSKSYLCEIEKGNSPKPSAEKLIAVVDVLGVDITYFFQDGLQNPGEGHIDAAFYRGYLQLSQQDKLQLRKILSTFKKG